jgi:hypothetical protein
MSPSREPLTSSWARAGDVVAEARVADEQARVGQDAQGLGRGLPGAAVSPAKLADGRRP